MPGRRGRLMNHDGPTGLIHWRGVRGLTQQQLADNAQIPLECVTKAERTGRRTNDNVITELATALGIAENAIIRGA